jgi:DNA adenine methylase
MVYMNRKLTTPVRYPGGKSRAIKFLMPKTPHGVTEYREPFVGGGSMAFAFSQANPDAKIWINDLYYNLYCFWTALQADPKKFGDEMMAKKLIAEEKGEDGHRALFAECKDTLASVDVMNANSRHKIGQAWWCLNKMSFSGLSESGTLSKQACASNFSVLQCSKLEAYGHHIKDWKITNQDYTTLLERSTASTLVFLDPPYDKVGSNGKSILYGKNGEMHKGFNHLKFYEDCQAASQKQAGQMLITYDSNPELIELWKQWYPESWDLTYTMHSGKNYRENEKKRQELLLSNYNRESHLATLEFG